MRRSQKNIPDQAGKTVRPRPDSLGYTILPFAGIFGSIVPLWFFAKALAHALGIPDHAPVKDQPYGWLWFALFMVSMWVFLFLGLLLGEFLNALVVRFAFGWSWTTIRAWGVCPRWMARRLSTLHPDPTELGGEVENPLFDPQLDRGVP